MADYLLMEDVNVSDLVSAASLYEFSGFEFSKVRDNILLKTLSMKEIVLNC